MLNLYYFSHVFINLFFDKFLFSSINNKNIQFILTWAVEFQISYSIGTWAQAFPGILNNHSFKIERLFSWKYWTLPVFLMANQAKHFALVSYKYVNRVII